VGPWIGLLVEQTPMASLSHEAEDSVLFVRKFSCRLYVGEE